MKLDFARIDRAINKLVRVHNAQVPDAGREAPLAYALQKDRFTGRIEVSAVKFPSATYRLRKAANEAWKEMR